MARRKHFHCLSGMPGYMPDNNNAHTSIVDARNDAQAQVKAARDEGERFTGSKRAGYRRTDGGWIVHVTECTVADCLTADGEVRE